MKKHLLFIFIFFVAILNAQENNLPKEIAVALQKEFKEFQVNRFNKQDDSFYAEIISGKDLFTLTFTKEGNLLEKQLVFSLSDAIFNKITSPFKIEDIRSTDEGINEIEIISENKKRVFRVNKDGSVTEL